MDPIQFRYLLKYEEIQEAYELAYHRSLRQGRWGGVLLILVGVLVPLVDWKDLSVIGFTMVLVGVYILVRSSQDLRKWYEHEKIGSETYEATIDDVGITLKGSTSTAQYGWSHFSGYRTSQKTVVLFHCQSYVALPVSELPSQSLCDLTALVATHLKPLPEPGKPTTLQIVFVLCVLALSVFFLTIALRNYIHINQR